MAVILQTKRLGAHFIEIIIFILIQISLRLIRKGTVLVFWRQRGDKRLPEPNKTQSS